MNNLWGEFDHKEDDDWNLSANDLEDLNYPEHVTSSQLVLTQPSQEDTASFQILPSEICKKDPLVILTTKLLHHQRFLLQLISRAQVYGTDNTVSLPPFPEDPAAEKRVSRTHELNFLPYSSSPFTAGSKKLLNLEIEANTARLMLRKSVIILLAHIGFVDTTESVIRVLVDVVHEFMIKLTRYLRLNMDTMLECGTAPSEDILDHTLRLVGIQGVVALHQMYKDKVILYHNKVKQRTLQLHHQYQAKLPGNIQGIKKEKSSDNTQEDPIGAAFPTPMKSEDVFSKLIAENNLGS